MSFGENRFLKSLASKNYFFCNTVKLRGTPFLHSCLPNILTRKSLNEITWGKKQKQQPLGKVKMVGILDNPQPSPKERNFFFFLFFFGCSPQTRRRWVETL